MERFGEPTWRRLVEAVEDSVGGNDCALAQTIARQHPVSEASLNEVSKTSRSRPVCMEEPPKSNIQSDRVA